jgi:protein tyrosine phosphatase (PTP) superfamily phosphohydrolase (DUF442 family)
MRIPACNRRFLVLAARRALSAAAAVLCGVLAEPVLAQAPPAAPAIRNFLRVNDQFCTGGQPRPEHFAELQAGGIKAVVNLRTPGEHRAAEEEATVRGLGMRYFNIPVAFSNPTDEQATEFLRITDDPANRPAFVHCTAAVRVGAFWMIRRVLRDGFTIEAAEAEAAKVGLVNSPHLNEFAKNYIAKAKAGR